MALCKFPLLRAGCFVTIRRALFFYSGQRGALCQLLLPADTKTSCISIQQTKALCTACVCMGTKTQLCIQQLKSVLHCKYSVLTHMWRSYSVRPSCLGKGANFNGWGGLAPPSPSLSSPLAGGGIFSRHFIFSNMKLRQEISSSTINIAIVNIG